VRHLCSVLCNLRSVSFGVSRFRNSILLLSLPLASIFAQSPLDSGPWPTLGHDNQRTNQSPLAGPAVPAIPVLLYDAGSSVGLNQVVVTSDGKIMMTACVGQVIALNAAGQSFGAAWPFTLMQTGYPGSPETPVGLTVSNSGTIYVATHECPDIPGAVPVHFYSIEPNATNTPNWPIPSTAMYWPAALGSDGTIFQMDELQTIHAYSPSGTSLWSITLPSYGQGDLALDAAGNVYVGTDSVVDGGHTVYSFTPSGVTNPGWPQDTGGVTAPTAPVIGPRGGVYIANTAGALYAFNPNGSLRSGFPFSSGGTVSQQPLAVSSSGIVYMKTSVGLYAVNADGTPVWATPFSPGGDATLSPAPVIDGSGNVYVAFGDSVYSLAPGGTVRLGWPVTVASAGPLVIGGQHTLYVVSGGQQLYAVRSNPLLLQFPVQTCGTSPCNPSNATINAVFDHDMKQAYECSAGGFGAVMPFTNQLANGSPSSKSYGCGGSRYGYQYTGAGTLLAGYDYNFTQNGSFLYYDGHPGYDYNFGYGTPVYPAVDGCVTYLQPAAGVANPENGHILAIIPQATEPAGGCQTATDQTGYSIVYMHLSSFYQNQTSMPNYGGVLRCTSSIPSVCELNEDTEVCSTCAQQNEYVTTNRTDPIGYTGNFFDTWGGVAPHLHFEVDEIRFAVSAPIPVDPYGWCGPPSTDPYTNFTGITNITLWANFSLTCP
jgi:hypothetical protein